MENKLQLLKVRSFSDVINDMFIFIRENLAALWRAIFLVVIPLAIVGGFFFSQYFSSIFAFTASRSAGTDSMAHGLSSMILNMLLCFAGLMLASICTQLIVITLFLNYENSDTALPQVKDLLGGLKSSILRFLGLSLALVFLFIAAYLICILFGVLAYKAAGTGIAVIFGMVLFFGFIYAVIPFSIVPFIYMRERNGVLNAISRAFYLVKGYWWQTFGVIFITQIIVNFASVIFAIPFYVFYFMSIFHSVNAGTPPVFESGIWFSLSGALMMVGVTMLTTLLYVSIIIQYYSLVERKDGENTMREIENIDASLKIPPFNFT